ncbi:MAG: Cell surface glycan-binding lipoprotein, utilization system for glycans and polysaccharides (PUL), SusD family [uncultured Cytophagales bacterium]|uniref:Cell surface glycan-binding lipoprotein, utilization system for glycans and polysaccharides (PUL), SusD family n=1 Tax=uncultured Cytophagales bacterium TaxID=158755 RepID=A0A6J4JG46_9SPHI|nr:MAG: Cell surface glycan-binding lipoprotein, utilization system for glycans and polysaccharides (PUL), SusD family [uncultured Cytophagales bacterium]
MKKLIRLLPVFLLWSCEDALREAPKAIAAESFYNTVPEVESAMNAIYQQLRAPNNISGQLGAQLEAYTDYSYGRGSYQPLTHFQGLNTTNISRTDEAWRLFYLGIRNANFVIANAPRGKNLTPDAVKQLVAEARFLRAYNYFWLVRNWGGVPLRTEATLTQPNVARSPADEVYNLILADLAEAEASLPETQSQTGRATRWAAKAALAEVYFTRGQYAQARDKADAIIQSGQFSLVPVAVAGDFEKIFGPAVGTTPEEIFYLKMVRVPGQGMYLPLFAHHPGSRLHGAGGFFAHYTDAQLNSFFKNWDDLDLRKRYNWYPWNIGLGANTLLNKKFSDPSAPAGDAAGNDYPVYRYADVLLLYAEAAARAGNGPTAEALEALNQVHRRAYGQPVNAPSAVDFKLADHPLPSFVDLVIRERGYETQYEAKRWLDLKRLGPAELKARIKAATGKDVADKHLLWPIPVGELNYNAALTPGTDQNPGY